MPKTGVFVGLLSLVFVPALAQVDPVKYADQPPYSIQYQEQVKDLLGGFHTPLPILEQPEQELWRTWSTVQNYTFGKDRGSMPMIADLEALHPYFRDKIVQLISICESKGITLAIVETYRTHAKQNEYKSMGKKYTRSTGGHSKHQYGLAIDVVPVVDSLAQWDDYKLWKKVGAVGEQLGLRWGGRWRNPYDPGHFEWTGGLSSYHLSSGLMPTVPKTYFNPCLHEDLVVLEESWKAWEIEQATIARKPATSSTKGN